MKLKAKNSFFKKNFDKTIYLNYGQLDSIFEFKYLGIKKSYNFSDVVKLVNQLIYKDRKIKNYASNLEIYYRKCHYHSHANLYGFRFPIIYIMDLCKGLGEVLLGIAYEINNIEKVELFNSIDLVKNARMSVDRLHKMREDLTTEQLEKYYKNRNQYKARALLQCFSFFYELIFVLYFIILSKYGIIIMNIVIIAMDIQKEVLYEMCSTSICRKQTKQEWYVFNRHANRFW